MAATAFPGSLSKHWKLEILELLAQNCQCVYIFIGICTMLRHVLLILVICFAFVQSVSVKASPSVIGTIISLIKVMRCCIRFPFCPLQHVCNSANAFHNSLKRGHILLWITLSCPVERIYCKWKEWCCGQSEIEACCLVIRFNKDNVISRTAIHYWLLQWLYQSTYRFD